MIVVIASITAKTGKEEELEETLKSLFPKVQNEEGTLEYTLNRGLDEAGKFTFYEKYKDENSLDFHNNTSYLQDVFKQFDSLLEGNPKIEIYEEVMSIK